VVIDVDILSNDYKLGNNHFTLMPKTDFLKSMYSTIEYILFIAYTSKEIILLKVVGATLVE